MADLHETIATYIRAYHRAIDTPGGRGMTHTGDRECAKAIIDLLRGNADLLNPPDMFWDAACPEEPVSDLDDVQSNTVFGEITELWRAVKARTIFVTWLEPRAGSDEAVYVEGYTLAEVNMKVAAELESRGSVPHHPV